jgi:hypothetical protein
LDSSWGLPLSLLGARRLPFPRIRGEPVIDTGYDSSAFLDRVKAIDRGRVDTLDGTTGPMDFDGFDSRAFAQTKVNPLIVRGGEAFPTQYVRPLAHAPSGEIDGSSHGIPGTVRTADQLKSHPVVFVGIDIAQQYRQIIQLIDHNVHFAVVEKIAEGRAPGFQQKGQPGAFYRRNELELVALEIVEEQGPLAKRRALAAVVDLRINMSIGRENVFPAIVVIVEKAGAPAEKGNGRLGNA